MNTESRRHFIQSSLTQAAAIAGAATLAPWARALEPFKRKGPPNLRLSLAAYSFRQYFKDSDDKKRGSADPAKLMDMLDFVDYCADHGCDGAEVTSYYFPKSITSEFLVEVHRRAFMRGISISGTAVGNSFTAPAGPKRDENIAHVKAWVDRSLLLNAPHIRVFAGNADGQPIADAKKNCIECLEDCGEYAAKKGVFLGIENHGGIVAESKDLLDILHTVKNPWIGINLDTANFRTTDPYADIALCAPYAVNVQMKGEVHPRDKPEQPADIPRLVRILREANYQGYVALEYESAEDPWTAVPRLLKTIRAAFNSAATA